MRLTPGKATDTDQKVNTEEKPKSLKELKRLGSTKMKQQGADIPVEIFAPKKEDNSSEVRLISIFTNSLINKLLIEKE